LKQLLLEQELLEGCRDSWGRRLVLTWARRMVLNRAKKSLSLEVRVTVLEGKIRKFLDKLDTLLFLERRVP
jgi:hypothetical protein